MSTIVEKFEKIKLNIQNENSLNLTKIVAVSKTFPLEHIMPLVEHGHKHYGENKVQEAISKWKQIKKSWCDYPLNIFFIF